MKHAGDLQPPSGEATLETTNLQLSRGRTLSVECRELTDSILLRSSTGEIELAIELGPGGPRLRVRAVDIELSAARTLALNCETLEVSASGSIGLTTAGPLNLRGQDVHVAAPAGEITLAANDDVALRGERILLNSDERPLPMSWGEFDERAAGRQGR